MSLIDAPPLDLTAEDLAARVGPIPLSRIRLDPPPGEATEEDVERIRREEGSLCELINGVLVEKAVSDKTSGVAAEIIGFLHSFIRSRRLGWILGTDGFVRLFGAQLRAPDVSFVRRDQRPPGGLLEFGYSDIAPALAVEVFSPGNTPGEMKQKREEFFAAGTELFWIVYPDRQEVEVWANPTACRTLTREDTLDGGTVLPGFSVKVAEIFENVDLGSDGEQNQATK